MDGEERRLKLTLPEALRLLNDLCAAEADFKRAREAADQRADEIVTMAEDASKLGTRAIAKRMGITPGTLCSMKVTRQHLSPYVASSLLLVLCGAYRRESAE